MKPRKSLRKKRKDGLNNKNNVKQTLLNERRVIDESSQIPFGEELRKEQIERIPMLLKLNDFVGA